MNTLSHTSNGSLKDTYPTYHHASLPTLLYSNMPLPTYYSHLHTSIPHRVVITHTLITTLAQSYVPLNSTTTTSPTHETHPRDSIFGSHGNAYSIQWAERGLGHPPIAQAVVAHYIGLDWRHTLTSRPSPFSSYHTKIGITNNTPSPTLQLDIHVLTHLDSQHPHIHPPTRFPNITSHDKTQYSYNPTCTLIEESFHYPHLCRKIQMLLQSLITPDRLTTHTKSQLSGQLSLMKIIM